MTEKQKQIIMKLAGDPELLKEFLEMTNAMGATPVANEATVSLYVIKRHTEDGKEYYLITDRGRLVARELKSDLLTSMLDKSLAQALRYLDFKKRKIVTRCTVEKTDDGRYMVTATFTEKGVCIFSQSLVVDTENRAERMRDNFYDRPEIVYRGVVALMAGNVNYLFD